MQDPSEDRRYHVVITAQGSGGMHWGSRVGYYWYKKIKAQCEAAGNCQVSLHGGRYAGLALCRCGEPFCVRLLLLMLRHPPHANHHGARAGMGTGGRPPPSPAIALSVLVEWGASVLCVCFQLSS
jgi:hypothetical protein